jgi:hypothetical protein
MQTLEQIAAAFGMPVTAALPVAKPAKRAKLTPGQAAKKARAKVAPKFDSSMALVIVASANPYRKGTKAHATFAMFTKAGTVAKAQALAKKAGRGAAGKYDIGYLKYASRDGHIAFAPAAKA